MEVHKTLLYIHGNEGETETTRKSADAIMHPYFLHLVPVGLRPVLDSLLLLLNGTQLLL